MPTPVTAWLSYVPPQTVSAASKRLPPAYTPQDALIAYEVRFESCAVAAIAYRPACSEKAATVDRSGVSKIGVITPIGWSVEKTSPMPAGPWGPVGPAGPSGPAGPTWFHAIALSCVRHSSVLATRRSSPVTVP